MPARSMKISNQYTLGYTDVLWEKIKPKSLMLTEYQPHKIVKTKAVKEKQ